MIPYKYNSPPQSNKDYTFLKLCVVDIATGQRFALYEALARHLAEDTGKVIVITELGSDKPLTEEELKKIIAERNNDYEPQVPEIVPLDPAKVKSLLSAIKNDPFEAPRPPSSWPFSSDRNPAKNATKMKHRSKRPLIHHISSSGVFFRT